MSKEEADWWEFVFYLGNEFNIEIPIEEMKTVGEIVIYIEKHRRKS